MRQYRQLIEEIDRLLEAKPWTKIPKDSPDDPQKYEYQGKVGVWRSSEKAPGERLFIPDDGSGTLGVAKGKQYATKYAADLKTVRAAIRNLPPRRKVTNAMASLAMTLNFGKKFGSLYNFNEFDPKRNQAATLTALLLQPENKPLADVLTAADPDWATNSQEIVDTIRTETSSTSALLQIAMDHGLIQPSFKTIKQDWGVGDIEVPWERRDYLQSFSSDPSTVVKLTDLIQSNRYMGKNAKDKLTHALSSLNHPLVQKQLSGKPLISAKTKPAKLKQALALAAKYPDFSSDVVEIDYTDEERSYLTAARKLHHATAFYAQWKSTPGQGLQGFVQQLSKKQLVDFADCLYFGESTNPVIEQARQDALMPFAALDINVVRNDVHTRLYDINRVDDAAATLDQKNDARHGERTFRRALPAETVLDAVTKSHQELLAALPSPSESPDLIREGINNLMERHSKTIKKLPSLVTMDADTLPTDLKKTCERSIQNVLSLLDARALPTKHQITLSFTASDTNERGHYNHATKTLFLGNKQRLDAERTCTHELGHHLEMQNGRLSDACVAFYEKRRASSPPARHLGPGYDPSEVTFEDDFVSPYMGKVYESSRASEILSMGLEIMADPERRVTLWQKDPEYFSFMMAVLSGQFGFRK